MLSNFRKIYLDPLCPPEQDQQSFLSRTESQADTSVIDFPDQMNDAVAQRRWDVPSCTYIFCGRHSEIDNHADPGLDTTRSRSQSYAHHSLPSTRSIVQVLYPPSYLGTPHPFPDPPSYPSSDYPLYPARGHDTENSPLISSTTTSVEGTPLSRIPFNPLTQDPSLTGVPSQGTPSSRIPPVEPNPPIIALGGDVVEENEPPPAYSRFDQRRPRFPAASDILGPYPPLSDLCQAAQ